MAKMFKLEIECDNEAFGMDLYENRVEIARILRELGDKLGHSAEELYPNSAQWVRDYNGNRVGTYKFEDRDRIRQGK
jgi:hypothetical protein